MIGSSEMLFPFNHNNIIGIEQPPFSIDFMKIPGLNEGRSNEMRTFVFQMKDVLL